MDIDRIEIPQDGAFLAEYLFEETDDAGVTTPRDWTGSHARAQVRRTIERTSPLLGTMTDANGLITLTADGRLRLHFTVAFVATLPPGRWPLDVRTVDAGGNPDNPFRVLLTIPDTTTGPDEVAP
jgi:transposase InsO family protein